MSGNETFPLLSAVDQPGDDERIIIKLHPESLMCAEYREHVLDPQQFLSLTGDWQAEKDEREEGMNLLSSEGGVVRLRVLGDSILRLTFSPDRSGLSPTTTERLGLIDTGHPPAHPVTSRETGADIVVESGDFVFTHHTRSGDFSVAAGGQTLVESTAGGARFAARPGEGGGHRSMAAFRLDPEEKIWGFGGRVQPLNRRGQGIDMFSEKVGRLFGDYGGFPIPFFISSRGYGVFFNNPWPHVYFDMGKHRRDQWFVAAPGGECDLFIIRGPEVGDIVRRFTALTGRIAPPQKSVFGFWVSSLAFETAEQMLEVSKRLRTEDWPCDNVVLDGTWRGGPEFITHYKKYHEYMNNDLQWHPDFGDGAEMVRRLHAMGFKVSLHLNSRVFTRETAARGLQDGLLRKHEEEVVVKLECPQGERFFRDHLQPRIDEGVDFWWTDHTDRVSGEIRPGIPSRNLFGPLWNRLLSQAMAEAGRGERLSLSRGGGIGSQRYALPWPGDTAAGLDRYAEDIWYCLNAGLTGFPVTSVDMGGFCPPDPEMSKDEAYTETFGQENLHRRLFQSIMFIPAPRVHNNYGEVPRLPWNCPEGSRPLYKAFLQERYKLTPYFYSLGLAAAKNGEPILRPLFYEFLQDPVTHEISDVFLIGHAILVAPVTGKNCHARQFYLPSGRWYDYWTNHIFEGGRDIELPCPIDQLSGLPMLVRAGSIVPLQDVSPSLDPDPPVKLRLIVYPDQAGQAALTLYEGPALRHDFSLRPEENDNMTLRLQNHTGARRVYEFTCADGSVLRPIDVDPNIRFSSGREQTLQCSVAPGADAAVRVEKGQPAN